VSACLKFSSTPFKGKFMRADIHQICEASMRARQKLDADRDKYGPKPRELQKIHEPRQTKPPSVLGNVLAFLRTHLIVESLAAAVKILHKDAGKARADEAANSQCEQELYWSRPERRRCLRLSPVHGMFDLGQEDGRRIEPLGLVRDL
jgi:hypothetical protein